MHSIQSNQYHIRKACADDAHFAAPLIYNSGPEHHSYFLTTKKTQPIPILEKMFQSDAGMFGHSNHWVIERDGQALGISTGYTAKEVFKLDAGVILWILCKMPLFYRLAVVYHGLLMASQTGNIPKDMLYLADISVVPEARGQSLGTKMIQFHIQRAKELGLKQIGLDVADNNPNAQRLYERMGMTLQWKKPFTGNSKVNLPAQHRLSMPV